MHWYFFQFLPVISSQISTSDVIHYKCVSCDRSPSESHSGNVGLEWKPEQTCYVLHSIVWVGTRLLYAFEGGGFKQYFKKAHWQFLCRLFTQAFLPLNTDIGHYDTKESDGKTNHEVMCQKNKVVPSRKPSGSFMSWLCRILVCILNSVYSTDHLNMAHIIAVLVLHYTVVSVELGTLEMLCSIYWKSQRLNEELNQVSPSGLFSSNVHVCIHCLPSRSVQCVASVS